jgi:integrase
MSKQEQLFPTLPQATPSNPPQLVGELVGELAGKKPRQPLSVAKLESLIRVGKASKTTDARTPGLFFDVSRNGTATWWYRYFIHGKRRVMPLGRYPGVGLAEGREKALAAGKLRREGIDPLASRRADKIKGRAQARNQRTVLELIAAFEKAKDDWARKSRKSFKSRMVRIIQALGHRTVREVDREMAKEVLESIWLKYPATAKETARMCGQMWDWADYYHWRQDDPKDPVPPNPWRQMQIGMAAQPERRGFAALPWQEMPAFMAKLRAFEKKGRTLDIDRAGLIAARNEGMMWQEIAEKFKVHETSAQWIYNSGRGFLTEGLTVKKPALEALVLTALRTSELLCIQWPWIDWERKTLVIPRIYMKVKKARKGRPQTVPLCDRMIEILHQMEKIKSGDFVFPGSPQGRSFARQLQFAKANPGVQGFPMHANTLQPLIRDDMGYRGIATDHGFRSSFFSWGLDNGYSAREILLKFSLDHVYGTQVDRAYTDTTILEERRELMQDWADFCDGLPVPRRTVT